MSHTSQKDHAVGLSFDSDREVVLASGRRVAFETRRIAGVVNRVLMSGGNREETEALALEISKNYSLEEFLLRASDAGVLEGASLDELKQHVAFYRAHPSWWNRAVEVPFAALTEMGRAELEQKWALTAFDVGAGASKGVYAFGKGIVVGIADLLELGYQFATESETREKAAQFSSDAYHYWRKLNWGTASERKEALLQTKQVADSLVNGIADSVVEQWDAAVAQKRETELVSKWVTQGVCEIATFFLAALKGGKAAEAASAVSKAGTAEKVSEEAVALHKAIAKVPRKKSPGNRYKKVSPSQRKHGTELLEDWYRDHSKIGNSPKNLKSHMKGSLLRTRVRRIKLKKGMMLEQWVGVGRNPGIYFGRVGADPAKLGIDLRGRVRVLFKVEEPFFTMETVVKDFQAGKVAGVGGKGGEIQYIMPPDWERYVRRL